MTMKEAELRVIGFLEGWAVAKGTKEEIETLKDLLERLRKLILSSMRAKISHKTFLRLMPPPNKLLLVTTKL